MEEWQVGAGGVGHCPRPVKSERRTKQGRSYVYVETKACKCGKCAICGYPLHSAVHMHAFGSLPGSEPFDHRFHPKETTP